MHLADLIDKSIYKSDRQFGIAYLEHRYGTVDPDEYDKTVIDYALEAGNYSFLKFLVDNGYIWFVGNEKKEYYAGFGAGTVLKDGKSASMIFLNTG